MAPVIKALFLSSVLVFTSCWAPSARGKGCGKGVAEPATILAAGALVTAIIIGSCDAIDQHQEEQWREREEQRREREEQRDMERRQEERERHEMEMERLRQKQKSAALIQIQSGRSLMMSRSYELEGREEKNRTFGIVWNLDDRMKNNFIRDMWWGMNGVSVERWKQRDDHGHPFHQLNLSPVTDESDRLQALSKGTIDRGLLQGETVNEDAVRIYYESLISDTPQPDKTWNTVGKYIFGVCNSDPERGGQFLEYDDFTDDSIDWKPNKQIYDNSDSVDIQELICNPAGVSSDYRINLVIQEQVDETAAGGYTLTTMDGVMEGGYEYDLGKEPRKNQEHLKRRIDPILREMAGESIVWFLKSEQEYQHRPYLDLQELQDPGVGLENIRHLIHWINSMAWEIIKAQDPLTHHWFNSPLPPEEPDISQALSKGIVVDAIDGIYEPFMSDVPQFEIGGILGHQTYQIHFIVQKRDRGIHRWNVIGGLTRHFNAILQEKGF